MNSEQFPTETTTYAGHDVLDEKGHKIGKVTDVVYDDRRSDAADTMTPTWMVVDPGMMRASHYVPVEGTYRSQGDEIIVPWDKEWLKSAPKASGDHILTDSQRDELEQHYRTSA